MSSTFRGLGIGISGVFAQQRALDVTGHNISNVNTPGYTRQIISHQSTFSQNIGRSGNGRILQIGMGVDVQTIKQYRDELLDKKLRKGNTELGYWESRLAGIEELETVLGDTSEEGLQTVMDNFWNAWEQLSKPTGGIVARSLVKENAIALVETVKTMDGLLTSYRRSKDKEIIENINQVNQIAKRISELNLEIKKIESHGTTANDYRDERNNLVLELSKKAKIQVIEGSTFNIALEGRLLVEDNRYEEIAAIPDASNNGFAKLSWKSTKEAVNISGGSIKSMFDARDEIVKGYRDKLDELVKGVANEVNAIHFSGYGVKDSTHRYFFINKQDGSAVGINLSNIEFNPELNEFDNIAAAEEAGNYEDNRIAIKIAELRSSDAFSADGYETDFNLRKYNFDEFFRNIITDLGNMGNEAQTATDAQKLLIDQIEFRRQSVSAVSLDEEMSNLIRFEHSYNAAARIVNAMDEMLDIMINKMGLTGR